MCRKSEGPSELIGSAGDKGGLLQRRKPTGRWSHKGGGEKARGSFGGEKGRAKGH